MTSPPLIESPFARSLLAGAFAGTTVDLALYPLDTLKTRLQMRPSATTATFATSAAALAPNLGARVALARAYAGVASALVGAAPGAALFFVTYETGKRALRDVRRSVSGGGGEGGVETSSRWEAADQIVAAAAGETVACAIRVPAELVKQRTQARQHPSSLAAARALLAPLLAPRPHQQLQQQTHHQSSVTGAGAGAGAGAATAAVPPSRLRALAAVYRGGVATLLRELPFTAIQFPLWEALKAWAVRRRLRRLRRAPLPAAATTTTITTAASLSSSATATALEGALAGSVSGAVAAAATTPLDVLKTRAMLARAREPVPLRALLADIVRREGARALFAGLGPRVVWISVGGAVFLGSYQWAANALGAAAVIRA